MRQNKHISTMRIAKQDPLTINHLVILTCLNEDNLELNKLARSKKTAAVQKAGQPQDVQGDTDRETLQALDEQGLKGGRNPLAIAMLNVLANEVNKAVSKSLGCRPPSIVCQRVQFAAMFGKTHIREEATLIPGLVVSEPVAVYTKDGCKASLKRKRRRITLQTQNILPLKAI